ncbi:type II toxin-antitoxin system RelE/ParE family toxin [Pseudanabaena biceps]|nr:type II toxin-antitoxin system RelE/ParE family toxin [Pseudanabaena biceps]
MNVKFESRFEKDLKLVKDRNLLARLKQMILTCKQAESLGEINNLKKMQGYDSFYRIRLLGDYRVGIEVLEDEVIFVRFLHRKDIYKFFP